MNFIEASRVLHDHAFVTRHWPILPSSPSNDQHHGRTSRTVGLISERVPAGCSRLTPSPNEAAAAIGTTSATSPACGQHISHSCGAASDPNATWGALGWSAECSPEEEDEPFEDTPSPVGWQSPQGCHSIEPMFIVREGEAGARTVSVLREQYVSLESYATSYCS